MAIYHFSVKNISRGDGRSAVACAAYRSGEKLEDCYQGKFQDYTQKTGVEYTEIYAPKNTNEKLLNRQNLWNAVEQVERRKDAILAREFEIAFPCEFDSEQRKQLLDDLCFKIVKEYNVIVDAAIHAPHTSSGSDERNYHAHIMFTARAIDLENGDFSKKKYRDFNREIREEIIDNQKIKKVVGVETVKHWRESFADLTNQHLEANDIKSRVDHRSYKDQESDLEATQHEGPQITQLRRQGIFTEISLKNDEIKNRNEIRQIIKGLDQEILASENLVNDLKEQYSQTDDGILQKYQEYVDGVSERLKKYEQEALEKKRSDLAEKIEEIKTKEPMFFGRQRWVEEHNSLVLQYQETIALIKKRKKIIQDRHIEQAKVAIRKNKPELCQRAEEILLERASMLQRKEDAIQHARKIHEENEQKQLKERKFSAEWSNTSARFNREQIENYNFQVKCIMENYPDEFYRKVEIEKLKKELINNPNYIKYRKSEFSKKSEEPVSRKNQEKRSDNDYDPPSPF